MTPLPQQVTSRYPRNLLVKGKNNEFHLLSIVRKNVMVDGVWLANYYEAEIVSMHGMSKTAIGASPEVAVGNCLAKHGITFR